MRCSVSAMEAASIAGRDRRRSRSARRRRWRRGSSGTSSAPRRVRKPRRPRRLARQRGAEQGEAEGRRPLQRPAHPSVVGGARAVQAERAGAVAQPRQKAGADDVPAGALERLTGEGLIEGDAAAGQQAGGHGRARARSPEAKVRKTRCLVVSVAHGSSRWLRSPQSASACSSRACRNLCCPRRGRVAVRRGFAGQATP